MVGGRGRGGRGRGGRGAPPDDPDEDVVDEMQIILTNLEFPEQVIDHIVNFNGIDRLKRLANLHKESIDRMFSRMDTLQIQYSIMHISSLRSLSHYARRNFKQNTDIYIHEISHDILSEEIDMMEDSTGKQGDLKSKVSFPEKFTKDTHWRRFKEAFNNYLDSIIGAKGVPLTYVTRPSQRPAGVPEDDPVQYS